MIVLSARTLVIEYTLGCFSVMVASYERDEFCVLK